MRILAKILNNFPLPSLQQEEREKTLAPHCLPDGRGAVQVRKRD
jgi:hypothetical protein